MTADTSATLGQHAYKSTRTVLQITITAMTALHDSQHVTSHPVTWATSSHRSLIAVVSQRVLGLCFLNCSVPNVPLP